MNRSTSTTVTTNRCPECKKKIRTSMEYTCEECSYISCLTHRFHTCPGRDKKLSLPEKVVAPKISEKI